MITGRFAPSPSGRMHLGNAFSCLLAWLSARSKQGQMILRMEDLDPDRCRPEYCQQLEEDLRWLGLSWEKGGFSGKDEYFQSKRSAYYDTYLNQLGALGLLYPCFCSRNDLLAASAPHRSDGAVVYPGTCRGLTIEERAERALRKSPAVRVRVPEREISFSDGNLGVFSQQLARECGDFVLRRADGVHAYQLAVVVDDALMGVTEVVRGSDLLDSTPRQLWLQEVLGFSHPVYYHVPLLLAPDGRRLSKRERDLDLGALRTRLSSQELVGRLAFLAGLLPKPEPLSPEELIPRFSWDKVRKENIYLPAEWLE